MNTAMECKAEDISSADIHFNLTLFFQNLGSSLQVMYTKNIVDATLSRLFQ